MKPELTTSATNCKDPGMPEKRKPGRPKVLPPDLDDRLMVRCSGRDKEVWEAHARKLGFNGIGQWLRKLANDSLAKQAR